MKNHFDALIIGAGASGLMCAIRAGEHGLSVLVLDKSPKPGQKILISGGGRCNFTNYHICPEAYLSPNPHFCKSALSRYTQWHIIELLDKYHLTYHEKTLGQLFCDQKSSAVVDMLVSEATRHNVTIACNQSIEDVSYRNDAYTVCCENNSYTAKNLIIACGGPSFAKIGGSDFALRLAKQFKLKNTPFSPALVPLTLPELLLAKCKPLAGLSTIVEVNCNGASFKENLLFTHRGLSGPAILQISSYWKKGDGLVIDLYPTKPLYPLLSAAKKANPKQRLATAVSQYLPKKLAESVVLWQGENLPLQQYNDQQLKNFANGIHRWSVSPSGSEGMKKAEVCTGGISPDELSSKTFAVNKQPGLYAIGEAVDVTGWLGGYNFQWAWSSGWCCGDALAP